MSAKFASLPTYASAGRNATIALVVLRLIQGLSVGGQLAGAYVSVVEAAPPARPRLLPLDLQLPELKPPPGKPPKPGPMPPMSWPCSAALAPSLPKRS